MIGHTVHFEAELPLQLLGEFMLIGVAYFFFVSAMGLARSFAHKEGYLKGFLYRKCGYLFSIVVLCFVQNEGLRILFGQHQGYGSGFLAYFWEHVNWYVWEQLFFYILFFVAYRFFSRHAVAVVAGVTVAGIHVLYGLGSVTSYYISSIAFPLGLVYYTYYDRIKKVLLSPGGFAGALLLAAAGCCSLFCEGNLVADAYLRNILCMGALFLLCDALTWFRPRNRALRFLRRYSTEIYLYQFICLELAPKQYGRGIYVLLVILFTLILAMLMSPLDNSIYRLWGRFAEQEGNDAR